MAFVDVSHVMHLTPSAAEIARLLLDGIAAPLIVRLLAAWHPETPSEQIAADLRRLEGVIDALKQPSDACPTCHPEFERSPVFSPRSGALQGRTSPSPTPATTPARTATTNRSARARPLPVLRDWRRVIRTLARIGVPHVIFTGGEPTLCDGLPDLIRCAERLGQITGVNTNGRRLADARFAAWLTRPGLDHVQITLDSYRPGGTQRDDRRCLAYERDGRRHPATALRPGCTRSPTRRSRDGTPEHAGRDRRVPPRPRACGPSP